jgi:hypothetical protein
MIDDLDLFLVNLLKRSLVRDILLRQFSSKRWSKRANE